MGLMNFIQFVNSLQESEFQDLIAIEPVDLLIKKWANSQNLNYTIARIKAFVEVMNIIEGKI